MPKPNIHINDNNEWLSNIKEIPPLLDRQQIKIKDLEKSAVLVVDVQNHTSLENVGFWKGVSKKDAPYFFNRIETVIDNIKQVLDASRANRKTERIFTVIESLTKNGKDCSLDYKLSFNAKTKEPIMVPKGSWGAKVVDKIAPAEDGEEIVLPKSSCSVFVSTNIHYVLTNLNVKHLIVVGQMTNQCVESAVRDAADLGYLVTVVEDACAANSEKEHESGLFNMRGFARIVKTKEINSELKSEVEILNIIDHFESLNTDAASCSSPKDEAPKLQANNSSMLEANFGKIALFNQDRGLANALHTALTAAGVKWLRFATCDIANRVRAKAIYLGSPDIAKHPEKLLDGVGFVAGLNGLVNYAVRFAHDSGFSGQGLDRLVGNFETMSILPYKPTHATVYGTLVDSKREPIELCPRSFLKRQICVAENHKLFINIGVEIEFTITNIEEKYCFAESRALDLPRVGEFLDEVVECIGKQANSVNPVELMHREGAMGQYELVIKYSDSPMKIADSIITVRETLHAVGNKHGFQISLLPKIRDGLGNGMHLHFSISKEKGGRNAFPDEGGCMQYGISEFGENFMGGILEDLDSLCAVLMASCNSYKRMQPGYWCGSHKIWGFDDKQASIRVCRQESFDIPYHFEVKTADATMNPYIALGCVIASGLNGVLRGVKLPPPPGSTQTGVEEYLPNNFNLALDAFEKNELFQTAMGKSMFKLYLLVKRDENQENGKLTMEEEKEKFLTFY